MSSSNLSLPYLTAGQAQKHVTVNESLQRLDAIVQLCVVSATTSAQPGSPTDGQVYILPSGKTGAAWGAMTNNALAYYRDGVWEEITPREGWLAFVKDADTVFFYTGSAWTSIFTAPIVISGTSANPLELARPGGGNVSTKYTNDTGSSYVGRNDNDVVVISNSNNLVSGAVFSVNPSNGDTTIEGTLTLDAVLKLKTYTVATLPAAATAGAGAVAYVTDSTTTTFNATVAGGGANKIGVRSDGTNWKVC